MTRRLERVGWTLALGATLALFAGSANAQLNVCDQPPDQQTCYPDCDGWTWEDECGEGIELDPRLWVPSSDTNNPAPVQSVLPCYGHSLPYDPNLCLEASQPDVFVAVGEFVNPLPPDLFRLTSASESAGGLGVRIHELTVEPDSGWEQTRNVSPTRDQKAVTLSENLDLNGVWLGSCNYGTPNNRDDCEIFTLRIQQKVNQTCEGSDICQAFLSSDGHDPADHVDTSEEVIDMLTLWVVNHELGHTLKLTRDLNPRYAGYHLRPTQDAVMAQYPVYQNKKGKVTFFIPGVYHQSSVEDRSFE